MSNWKTWMSRWLNTAHHLSVNEEPGPSDRPEIIDFPDFIDSNKPQRIANHHQAPTDRVTPHNTFPTSSVS